MDKKDMTPRAIAELDQIYAEANKMYGELVDVLRVLAAEHGTYQAMAFMGRSLENAKKETLISMVLTGMHRDMNQGGSDGI